MGAPPLPPQWVPPGCPLMVPLGPEGTWGVVVGVCVGTIWLRGGAGGEGCVVVVVGPRRVQEELEVMVGAKMGWAGPGDDGHQDGSREAGGDGRDQEQMMGAKVGPEKQEEMMGAKVGWAGPGADDGRQGGSREAGGYDGCQDASTKGNWRSRVQR